MNAYIAMTAHHYKALMILKNGRSASLDTITGRVGFIRHSNRVLRILPDLRDTGFVTFHGTGLWMISDIGRAHLTEHAAQQLSSAQLAN